MAVTTPSGSPRMSVTAPASMATSVPGAHRDADVRLRQRGGVVEPVAHHRHDAALGLEPPDLVELPLGQHLRHHPLDADRAGHARRGPPVVAGEHHGLETHLAERRDGDAGWSA